MKKDLKEQCVRFGGEDLLAEMEYNIHNVFISVKSPEMENRCVFVSLEWALHIYIGSGSSSTESAMFLQ